MNLEFGANHSQLRRPDQGRMRDGNLKQLAIEFGCPEVEKAFEFWKARGQVVLLPDIALQQGWIVWQAVDDFRRGQAEACQLGAEIVVEPLGHSDATGGARLSHWRLGHWQSPLNRSMRALPSLV
jgi:hypothetical protein